jgi:hypothetical protein
MLMRLLPCLLLFAAAPAAFQPSHRTASPIQNSEDVEWLERIVLASEADAVLLRSIRQGQPKDMRTDAYARLGELGTDASLAAVRRIDSALTEGVNLTPTTLPLTTWPHPAWHFSDEQPRPLAETDAGDGRRFAVVRGLLLGASDLFLVSSKTPDDRANWTRPKLLPVPVKGDAGLSGFLLKWLAPDGLSLSYEQREPPPRAVNDGSRDDVTKRTWPPSGVQGGVVFNLSSVELDSDGDGWTNAEEQRLGLNPNRADTDGDGRPDGRDSCPTFAPDRGRADETTTILQRALFAVFSVGRSRTTLLVGKGVQKVQVEGYAGPILYDIDTDKWQARYGSGGVFVTWKIERRDPTEAVVVIEDWEGMLAAGGQEVALRNIRGTWLAVARRTTWVS